VAFSPDGTLLAGGYAGGTIRLWHPASGQPGGTALNAGKGVNGLAFSPDGKILASADADGTVKVWNPVTGQPAGPPLRAGSAVNGVAFSPAAQLAAAGADGAVHLWNTVPGPPARTDAGKWIIVAMAALAIALSVFAAIITTRGILAARSLWKYCS